MNIAIVGAGIVGVFTAYELAQDGHAVTVFEHHGAAAEGASFSHGGLTGAVAHPWAAPGLWSAIAQEGLALQQGAGWRDWLWRWHWKRHTSTAMAPAALQVLQDMARYSQDRMQALWNQLDMAPETTEGQMLVLRSEQARERIEPAVQALRAAGLPMLDLSAAQARKLEPGLGEDAPLACALHLPQAGAGNGRLAAQMVRQAAQEAGAQFVFQASVQKISAPLAGKPTLQWANAPTPQPFDTIVVCTGAATSALLQPLGLRLPLAAVQGYALNAPLRESLHAPNASVIDPSLGITIARLGQRIRITGGAALGAAGRPQHEGTLRQLYHTVNEWFPGGALLSSGLQIWRGARPMVPDGLPVLGATSIPGVWVNTAHGANGWAMASGCARALADLIAQRSPEVAVDAMAPERWR